MDSAATIPACTAFLAGMLAACTGSNATADATVPGGPPAETTVTDCSDKRIYTVADDGCHVQLPLGRTAELRVRDPQAPDPQVEGDAVELVETVNISASGSRAWELRARHPGTSRITISGREPYSLTIEVARQ